MVDKTHLNNQAEHTITPQENVNTDKNVWDRWYVFWHGSFIVLMMLSLVLLFTQTPPTGQELPELIFWVVVMCAWYAGHAYWMTRPQQTRTFYRFAYITIGLLIWFGISGVYTSFMFLLFIMYPSIFLAVQLNWAIANVVLLTCLTVLRLIVLQIDNLQDWVSFMVFSTIIGVGLGVYITQIIQQSEKRQALIEELAYTRKKLAETQHREGILEERQRLAREIHDTLAQGLTSIITLLEASENTTNDTTTALSYRTQAKQTARHNLEEARRFVQDLQPQLLDNHTLRVALQRLIDSTTHNGNSTTQFTVTGTPIQFHPAIEVVALRVTQEALTNIQKHADASHINITLTYLEQQIILDIQDNGIGFDANKKSQTAGFGLIGMQKRVQTVGGTLTIESAPDDGTIIAVELPVKPVEGRSYV